MPTWIPLAIVVAGVIWLFDGMRRGVDAAGFELVDPRSARLQSEIAFCDPRWDDVTRRSLAAYPSVSIHDTAAIERLRAAIAALPFVAGVGEARVMWPDSIDVPLRLRTPAACVMQGSEFLPVSEDGVFLPGRWPTPPWIRTAPDAEGYLPVLGPNDGAFDRVRPGERLIEARHQDALAVALEMRAELSTADFKVIGPPLIDASAARLDPLESQGVLVQLEGRRTIRFGRAAQAGAIGERPSARKWADVRRAIEHLRGLRATPVSVDARDWAFLDVRWDTPDITWRAADAPTAIDPAQPDVAKKRP